MDGGNLALVRAAVDALNRGEWEKVFAFAAPEVEYDLSRTESPLRGVHRGADEVARVAAEFYSPWDTVRYEIEELVAAGDQVVMPYTSRFARSDGIAVEARAVWVWTFRDGAVVRLCLYQDLDEALEEAGGASGHRRSRSPDGER